MTKRKNGSSGADACATVEAERPPVRWDDSKMSSSFANVVSIQGTGEQVDLLFGTNRTWNRTDADHLTIQLDNRITLTPQTAKRLWSALGAILADKENHSVSASAEEPAATEPAEPAH